MVSSRESHSEAWIILSWVKPVAFCIGAERYFQVGMEGAHLSTNEVLQHIVRPPKLLRLNSLFGQDPMEVSWTGLHDVSIDTEMVESESATRVESLTR